MHVTRIGAVFLVLVSAGTALAQPRCATRDTVVGYLASKYGETPQSMGLAADQTLLEVFANTETGTWTLLVTTLEGLTCFVTGGQNYESVGQLGKGSVPRGEPG